MRNWNLVAGLGKAYITLKAATLGYNLAVSLAAKSTMLLSGAKSISAFFSLAKSIKSAGDAMALFNLVSKGSVIGLIAGGIAAVGTAFALFSKKKKEATLENQKIDSQYIQTLVEEKTKITLLSEELKRAETPYERRKQIINELKAIQPSLVEGINAEATNYEQLTKNIEAYNNAKIKEVALEKRKGELAKIHEEAATALLKVNAREEDINNFRKKYSHAVADPEFETRSTGLAKNLKILQNQKRLAQSNYDKIERKANAFGQSIVDFTKAFGLDSSTTVNPPKTPKGTIPGAGDMDENIIKGGSSQKIINITVGKFQDTVTNAFYVKTDEIVQSAEALVAAQNENLLRILNSANQL